MNFKLDIDLKTTSEIFDARFHPGYDSDLFAVATISGNVNLYAAHELKLKLRKHHRGSAVRKVRFTDNGLLVTAAKFVKIHDLANDKALETLRRGADPKGSLYSLLPLNNSIISAGDDDGRVYVWDRRTPDEPIFSSQNCEQYISDIDSKYEAKRMLICTSGEGTLTAYDLRAKKMIEPQSELFEAGFQCVKIFDQTQKVVVGAEDGAIYVFNQDEWGNTSAKMSFVNDSRNRGDCSVDSIDTIPDTPFFVAGCSDGRLRAFSLTPQEIVSSKVFCKKNPIESVHVDRREGKKQILVAGDKFVNIIKYEEGAEDEDDGIQMEFEEDTSKHSDLNGEDGDEASDKKKNETEDYLNVF